ncbi:efflux RND transporter periplasmic adaptor subunit (plasmid) [Bradyrhizobium guangxiense]|uniref:efflux RND transporter periplasmic adaptor subunit n=1 Tax=Bradyrhizobium guangxiense TaxID=1325115 RepID=UPI0037046E00
MEAERERPLKAPLRVSIDGDGQPVVTLTAATRKLSGVVVIKPKATQHQEQIRAYGTVLDLDKLVALDNSYVTAVAQLQSVQARIVASKAALERAQTLSKDNITTLAQLQTAEATFAADQAGVATAEAQVRTLKATALQEWGTVIGKALVDGSPLVSRLIERQTFLLQITLPPGASASPPPSATVQFGASATPHQVEFLSPATQTDPKIQGLSFYYSADAASNLLPGMNVLAFLPSGAPIDAIEVPRSAVVWWTGRAWVYLRTGADTFTRLEIHTDAPTPEGGFIVSIKNLPQAVPELVAQGAQMLLSEEFRTQIQVGEDNK